MDHALIALALIGLVDSIAYMVVTPSLIFYVLECGGTKEFYGLALSAFSFASFCGKPALGYWIDATGGKFRKPYFASITLAGCGGLLYFLASAFEEKPGIATHLILWGRLLGGFGAANQALGFAYLAIAIPPEKQTQTSSILSMTRILGMAVGPAFNVLLAKVHGSISLGGYSIVLTPLNTVGIFLAAANLVGMIVIFFLLDEPPERKKPQITGDGVNGENNNWMKLKAFCCIDILLPLYTVFVINSSFQLIETAFAPAASDALGWGPVQTSSVLGGSSVLIFTFMMVVIFLSSRGVPDLILIGVGIVAWIIGGSLMYLMWVAGAPVWHFVLPTAIAVSGFPFIAGSNRSTFTRAVDSKPILAEAQGTMQALLSMFASVAGFTTPGFVASYVLKQPVDVAASQSHRELSELALYVPILSCLVLPGLAYVYLKKPADSDQDDVAAGEATGLMDDSRVSRRQSSFAIAAALDPMTAMDSIRSVEIMGIPQLETKEDKERRLSLWTQAIDEDMNLTDADF